MSDWGPEGWAVRLGDGQIIDMGGPHRPEVLVRGSDVDSAMGVFVFTHGVIPENPPHAHLDFMKIAYILEGEYDFRVGDGEFSAGPGTVVVVPKGSFHAFTTATGGRMLFACPVGERGAVRGDGTTRPRRHSRATQRTQRSLSYGEPARRRGIALAEHVRRGAATEHRRIRLRTRVTKRPIVDLAVGPMQPFSSVGRTESSRFIWIIWVLVRGCPPQTTRAASRANRVDQARVS
jgi:mannose-6-phosphate isomerase-like protein (cupin superfamily)